MKNIQRCFQKWHSNQSMIYKTESGRGVKDEKQKYVERVKKLNKNSVTFVNVNTS